MVAGVLTLNLLAAFQLAAATPLAARDSAAIVDSLHEKAADFLWVWRFYWEASEAVRHEVSGSVFAPQVRHLRRNGDRVNRDRLVHLHCHPDGGEGFAGLPTTIREGTQTLRAVCPDWSPPHPSGFDESVSIDDALIAPLRSGTTLARAELLAEFERAAHLLRGDPWIAGQRVRFAMDQRDTAAARAAAEECTAPRSWCLSLIGYLRFLNDDDVVAADSIFAAANAAMPLAERCIWTDLSALLDEPGFQAYGKVPCSQRDSVNARIWWLADPLYTEPRNERRAEHFARMVMIALRGAVMPAERWNWKEGDGGTSLRTMLLQYGWPTEAWWGGPSEDASHYGYLGIRDENVRELGVFTTMEYSPARFHTVPKWSAVADPWHATPSAWDIAAPLDARGNLKLEWWPQEHYPRHSGALVPIPEVQVALLRRRDSVELAVAADFARVAIDRSASRTATATIILTPSPDRLRFAHLPVSLDSTMVWRSNVQPARSVVGVEAQLSPSTSSVARMRFGIDPPGALSAMRRGEIAISSPVLLRPPRDGAVSASAPDDALASMLGTTTLRGVARIGVYWETYGIAAGDSVDVALRIERLATAGMLRRLGTALHVADRTDGSVTIRWTEPRPGVVTTTIDGPVPIQARNVLVDLSQLVPDRYSVTVSVTRAGQMASAMREFELRAADSVIKQH